MLALAIFVVACGGETPAAEQTDAVEAPAPEATPEAAAARATGRCARA